VPRCGQQCLLKSNAIYARVGAVLLIRLVVEGGGATVNCGRKVVTKLEVEGCYVENERRS